MIVLETARLRLRRFDGTDGSALRALFADPEVMRYGPGVQQDDWIRRWLSERIASYADLGYGPWAIETNERCEFIGYCGLFYFPDVAGAPEIELGYRLVRAHWGRGYATEAARAVRDHAFDVLNLSRLIALIDPQNFASIRVAEKIGMRLERLAMLPSYIYPDYMYAISHGNRAPTSAR